MGSNPLVQDTAKGLYCPAGDFFIDPWEPVERAVITHAHGDHARQGSKSYLTAEPGRTLLAKRMGSGTTIESRPYGAALRIGDVLLSFHPAGHVLGSSQIRLDHKGEIWVVSGDYKRHGDPTCDPFEPQRCEVFLTESTFALPIYRWKAPERVIAEIEAWWRANQQAGQTSLLFAYSLGKAQSLLALIDPSIGPILAHGAVSAVNELYRNAGINLPKTQPADAVTAKSTLGKALVLAPPSAWGAIWVRKFQPFSSAFASGWMQLRGARRRRALDRGFVYSDHADWPALLRTIEETGAQRVGVMHGYTAPLARFLKEKNIESWELSSHYREEEE